MPVPQFDADAVFEPEDYLYFYRDSLTEERTKKELAFFVNRLRLDRPMKILDLACGHGRHAVPLAEMGHDVTGIDIIPGFLDMAQKRAQEKGVTITLIREDMRQIRYHEEFDRVLLVFTAFGYFSDDENFGVLVNICRALKPGGLLYMDVHHKDVFVKNFKTSMETRKGKDVMIDTMVWDPATRRCINQRVVIRNGIRKEKPFFVRTYNPDELEELLRRAGFSTVTLYDDWDGKPFTRDSRRMIVVAGKRTT